MENKKEQVEKEEKIEKKKKNNNLMIRFFENLREDKIYSIALIITIVFFSTMYLSKVKEADGIIKKQNSNQTQNTTEIQEIEKEELDISDYVGIYSREVKLEEKLTINNTCQIDSYKYVYQIKKDNTINKYYYNTCVGSLLISSEKLDYFYDGNSKYIATDTTNYAFGTNQLVENSKTKYTIDEELFSIKELKKLSDVELYFYGNNIVYLTNNNLISTLETKITFNANKEYKSTSGNIEKRFSSSKSKYTFNFITFNTEDGKACYEDSDLEENAYTIYSIRFDVNSNNFLEAKEIVARSKSDGCEYYETDLAKLKE